MNTKINHSPSIFFVFFAISGFTGLIYESIWSHYLKLFLGHAAYAQALVLTIFMGGMALGAYLTSRLSSRWKNLLLVYAIVEIVIGCFGIVFHPLFQSVLSVSYEDIIPTLASPGLVHIYKWSIGTLIILPQSILLGMTFPLMSNGILRCFPNTPGRTLGMLYFTNSIGAAIGVLFSGFYLIKMVGLPGTVLTAGIINILLAIVVYGVAKDRTGQPYTLVQSSVLKSPTVILLAAFITGAASFIYEISWLRMLSMVLGASTHAFELMLSAFITGLAFGGLWIRRKIDSLANPVMTTGYVQISMGIMALLTLPLYHYSFDLMSFFMSSLQRNDTGYQLFTLSSHLICLLIMLPATFCAGMTLPLFTFLLLGQGHGEKSIGQIYASNTLGAIAGIIFTIFIGMPILGLKGAILFACGLDIVLGLFLLSRAKLTSKRPFLSCAVVAGVAMGTMVLAFDLDKLKMSSGVFRTGVTLHAENTQVLFHKDAKTASVSVLDVNGTVSIITNGKPDASIFMGNEDRVTGDESTMIFAGALPIAIYPDAKLVANIGMGSGLTTHTLLGWPSIERVDTIEIESAMVEGAQHFRPRVEKAYTDPRSNIHIEDAKTYFSSHQNKYDIIISEPSNPWVSGTASLFTDEFYHHIIHYMSDDGLFVQWIQGYETNSLLLISVLKSLHNNFYDFKLYAPNNVDLFIVASKNRAVGNVSDAVFDGGEMEWSLTSIGINNLQDINTFFIADKRILTPFMDGYNLSPNSDYFPYLDLNATRARFKGENIFDFIGIRKNMIPVIDLLANIDNSRLEPTNASGKNRNHVNSMTHQAQNLLHAVHDMGDIDVSNMNISDVGKFRRMVSLAKNCQSIDFPMLWIDEINTLATLTMAYLTEDELQTLWDAITPKCADGLNENQWNWLAFMRALSQRDSEKIASSAAVLLEQGDDWDVPKRRSLLTAQATALVKLEKFQLAKQLLNEHVDLYEGEAIPLILMILHSISRQTFE